MPKITKCLNCLKLELNSLYLLFLSRNNEMREVAIRHSSFAIRQSVSPRNQKQDAGKLGDGEAGKLEFRFFHCFYTLLFAPSPTTHNLQPTTYNPLLDKANRLCY